MIYLFQLLKEIILEGGNVFGNTSSIRKENVVPTLKKFVQELNRIYPKVKFDFSILGSAGKKEESGDLDLALSSDHFLNKKGEPLLSDWKIDSNEFKEVYQNIRNKVRSSSEAQSRVRAMIEIISTNFSFVLPFDSFSVTASCINFICKILKLKKYSSFTPFIEE